jgi:eukaryotic-like serine/threonine-protein kinase
MEINKRIGDYEILAELGQGGMGRVYKVRNVISDRVEAMKVLLPDLVGRQDLASRFLREIKVLAALNHPHIATLRTALTAENQLVMIMEFVEGQSLAERLRLGPIPVRSAVTYVCHVLEALSYAHAQGVVHRDIKPANMMLTPEGHVKLTDFGIARSRNDQTLTAAGTTTGSLSYMSPEQVNGEPTDARSDLYSVGISLYEMVTGQRPFQADSDFAIMVAHLNEAPRPPIELQPALGAELNEVILTSIAKNPQLRFQSAAEFRDALRKLYPEAVATSTSQATGIGAAAAAETMVLGALPGTSPTFMTGGATRALTSATAAPTRGATAPAVVPPAAVPPIPVVPVARPRSGHPAVYVALGGALAIGALLAAGLYIRNAQADPRESTATASAPAAPVSAAASASPATAAGAAGVPPAASVTSSSPVTSAPPITSAPAVTSAEPVTSATPVTSAPPARSTAPAGVIAGEPAGPRKASPPPPAARGAALKEAARVPRPGPAGPPGARTLPPQPPATAEAPPQPAVDFDQLETEIDQLLVRASVVNRSLETMQQQQARQGLGLRGDMAGRQTSMNLNLTRAQQAVQQQNAGRAVKFKAMGEADVEALERFLGR